MKCGIFWRKKSPCWLWKATSTDHSGKTRLLVVGERSQTNVRRLIYRLQQHYRPSVYGRVLPLAQHKVGKELTYPIEQHNSNTRQY